MNTHISILRGINVSGQKKIKMADLNVLYQNLGFQDVQTYIQSGNVVFKSKDSDKSVIKNKIESKIREQYGFIAPVQILEFEELNETFLNNPFVNKRNEDTSKLHVTFLEEAPQNEFLISILNVNSASDEFFIYRKVIYLFCPNGYGRAKLNNTFFEKRLKTIATTRNWKTISKLIELSK